MLSLIGNSEELLNYAEKIESDLSLQLFIISFVEIDIDVSCILETGLDMLKALAEGNFDPLVKFVQECTKKIDEAGINNNLPTMTVDSLPIKSPLFFDNLDPEFEKIVHAYNDSLVSTKNL